MLCRQHWDHAWLLARTFCGWGLVGGSWVPDNGGIERPVFFQKTGRNEH